MRLRTDDLTWQRVGDEIIVLDLHGSSYLRLNGSGTVLWEALDQADRSSDDLVDVLVGRYEGVDRDDARRDVDAFVADLDIAGLLASG